MENKRELFQLLTRRFGLLNKNCCSIGVVEISTVQSHIIYEIDKQPESSMQQVAELLAMDITTFSRQIQNLIKMELVTKSASAQDKRVSLLALTVQGKFVATTIDESMNTYLEEVFSHMNEFERDTVLRSIELLNKAMSKSSVCCNTVC
ncbi:MarR family winged helix-turn-helix transcriptional regulator [Psychrobacillus psychrodurans]|uniref:MarR family winged helix-turn-helix transcriptional regulator n=1 Tax=Psychrobacillus psychrodurans TaxID=126157 RepID=UPI0008ED8FE0|nr:MarR family winged helix-turn-helix transcriptional regulator [Psychrobacillus psychrodurans]MCZ8539688.1 MarR family winged helix-turn-helix transcriptional regulator [Psychrobacillus psychrodurans]SFM94415.1 DNA-binding transcriptional regulator, MarR family [Psychrobacillus psychrodurans]